MSGPAENPATLEQVGELRVAGIEQAIVVGVEHVGERLQVGLGGRVPVGEDDLVALGDLAVAGEIEHQHAIARARPGGAVLIAVAGHVVVGVRGGERRDLDAGPGQVEDDGVAASITAAVATAVVSAAAGEDRGD